MSRSPQRLPVLPLTWPVSRSPIPWAMPWASSPASITGRAVGLALNATMANAAEVVPEVYAQVADALGAPVGGKPMAKAAALAAPTFDAWLRDIGLRIGLDDHGLCEADAERLAKLCFEPENKVMLETDSVSYSLESLRDAAARMLKAA